MAKRKQQFGSPPAVHKHNALVNAKEMRESLLNARNALKLGVCEQALEHLFDAENAAGGVFANSGYTAGDSRARRNIRVLGRRGRGNSPLDKMHKRFHEVCIVQSWKNR